VKPKKNTEVIIPEAYLNALTYKYEVVSNTPQTSDINKIVFKHKEGKKLQFKAGQYIQIRVPSDTDEKIFRAYSLASSEYDENKFSLLVKLIPGGLGSTYLHSVRPKDTIEFTGPYGDWRLDENSDTELLLIGGGSGLAPLRSIVLTTLLNQNDKLVSFYYGARTPEDLIDAKMFFELDRKHTNFRFIPSINEKNNNEWNGHTGFIHIAFANTYLKSKSKVQAFLCGPPPMIEAVLEEMNFKEIKPAEIFYDKF